MAEFVARFAPGGAILGQRPFDGDVVFGEPGHRVVDDADGGGGLLTVAELDMGRPSMTVCRKVMQVRA